MHKDHRYGLYRCPGRFWREFSSLRNLVIAVCTFQGLSGLASDLKKHNQVLVLKSLDTNLQSYIVSENVLFCSRQDTLKEIITQECIRSGSISLMAHIRASIDLGYRVEPLIIGSTDVEDDD